MFKKQNGYKYFKTIFNFFFGEVKGALMSHLAAQGII